MLDHAKVERADVVGNAWGGHVGVLLAARAPARVTSVAALCNPMQALRPAEAAQQVAQLPDGKLETIAGVGHLPPLEAPEATAALLTRWLSR